MMATLKIKTCIPQKLPLSKLKWKNISPLIPQAYLALGRFQGVLESLPHPETVLSLLKLQESFYSLKSQKIKVSWEETIRHVESTDEPPGDIQKILNYLSALEKASHTGSIKPLSLKNIMRIHAGVKKDSGKIKKEIGAFRKRQNWIGPEGCKIEEAYHYPPAARLVPRCMKNWGKYLNQKESDPLVQLAIVFAQLLVIHPFMDGNGRVGRILISLFLQKQGLIPLPLFFLSRYFYQHRGLYLKKLFYVSTKKKWEEWICFFLQAVIEEGNILSDQVEKINFIYRTTKEKLLKKMKEKEASQALNTLFQKPLFNLIEWETMTAFSTKKATKYIQQLEKLKIIKKIYKKQNVFWKFTALMKVSKLYINPNRDL